MNKEKIGNITVIHGDCMDYMRTLADKSFDLAIVDPPYGIGFSGHKETSVRKRGVTLYQEKKWDVKPYKKYFIELQRVCKNYIIWGANYFTDIIDLSKHSWFVWDKVQTANTYNFAMGELGVYSGKKPMQVFRYSFARNKNNVIDVRKGKATAKIHPCQKPIAVYKWLLHTYAKAGDRILDTHLGSGTLARACHDYGFELTGVELDAEYYDKMKQKLIEYQMQEKMFK